MKDVLRASYDRSAGQYDDGFAALQQHKFQALLGMRGEALTAALAGGGRALDLGCGTGLLAAWLEEVGSLDSRGPAIVGIDLSLGMARRARGRGVACVEGDLDRLPFRDERFAAALSFTSLKILPGPATRALAEATRVLRPGGLLAVSILKTAAIAGGAAFTAEVGAAGFRVGERVDCGQDWGWVCTRAGERRR